MTEKPSWTWRRNCTIRLRAAGPMDPCTHRPLDLWTHGPMNPWPRRDPMTVPPVALVSRRGEDRVRQGHPWIYRSDVLRVTAEAGDLVTVLGPRDRRLGSALFSDRSQIALRMVAV